VKADNNFIYHKTNQLSGNNISRQKKNSRRQCRRLSEAQLKNYTILCGKVN